MGNQALGYAGLVIDPVDVLYGLAVKVRVKLYECTTIRDLLSRLIYSQSIINVP